ncbi:hypothetical protein TNCV_4649701 [Trichonephila clavipes]|uniref:Uncharacterized protein n=1 Tax=Trichonephila clavipes TaxID=2585209 RepID=A0A8X6SYP3_TRICX|nr:hypothetical protein TNCV_4649701 [Trichonephila clavipes]
MTSGVVILEVTIIQPVKLPQSIKRIVIKNNGVGVGVELTINWDQGSQSITRETPSDHKPTSAKLYRRHNAF